MATVKEAIGILKSIKGIMAPLSRAEEVLSVLEGAEAELKKHQERVNSYEIQIEALGEKSRGLKAEIEELKKTLSSDTEKKERFLASLNEKVNEAKKESDKALEELRNTFAQEEEKGRNILRKLNADIHKSEKTLSGIKSKAAEIVK